MFTTGIFSQKTFEGLEKNEWIKENLRKDIKVQNEQTRVNNSTISNERTRIRFNPVKVCKDAKTHQTHWREGGIIKGKMEIFWLQSSSALRYAPTTAAACHWCSRVCVCVGLFFSSLHSTFNFHLLRSVPLQGLNYLFVTLGTGGRGAPAKCLFGKSLHSLTSISSWLSAMAWRAKKKKKKAQLRQTPSMWNSRNQIGSNTRSHPRRRTVTSTSSSYHPVTLDKTQ